ncbi:MAG: hypothetical protein JNK38_24525, partial [Acidobacteria bacterium]|nr:hypothetical protein [Acidobacteriota bacterium]
MKRIYTLALIMVLGVLLLPQRWVSLGAPEGAGSVFRQEAEPQEKERQGPPERLVSLSQVDSLPLAQSGDAPISRDPRRWRALVA